MPNFDGTGPDGKGPRTGRGLGNCKDNHKPNTNRPRKQNRRPRRKCPDQD